MKLWVKNVILITIVVIIAVIPLYLLKDAEFSGADGLAADAIMEINPTYETWFSPLLEPASGEIESLLFSFQAALGAFIIGIVLGRLTANKKDDKKTDLTT